MFSSRLPRCPFSSPKGKWRGLERDRGTESRQGAHIHHHSCSCKLQVHHPLTSLALGAKSSDPLQVWGGHAHQPGSSPGPNTAHSILLLPLVTAEAGGAHPLQTEGLPLGKGAPVGYLTAAGLALIWSVSSDLPCCTLTQSTLLTAVPSEVPPRPSETQSTQQGCAWGWPGRKRFLKAVNSTAGSSVAQEGSCGSNQHCPSWLSRCFQWGLFVLFVPFQMPFLSSGMNILPKAQRSCGDKAIHHPTPVGQVRADDHPFDTTDFKKNAASLTRQH